MPEIRPSQDNPQDVGQMLQTIRQLLLRQRKLILQTETDELLDVSRRIQDILQKIVKRSADGDDRLYFDEAADRLVAPSPEEQQLLVSVRNHARLNSELLADAVAYADLTLEVLLPGSGAGMYDQSGQRGSAETHELNKSA